MIVDLEDFRPQNVSWEHFFLQQVGRAYLFAQGIRCVATEVDDTWGLDNPEFGTHKRIIDVFGVDRRNVRDDLAVKMYWRICELAFIEGRKYGLTEIHNGNEWWKNEWGIKDEKERRMFEESRKKCLEDACIQLGYHPRVHENLLQSYKYKYEMRGIEVKVSYSDFKNGFSMMPEYSYVLAPIGIVPINELPAKVGLLEFDFEKYKLGDKWQDALVVSKKPKKKYDGRFLRPDGKKLDYEKHVRTCEDLLFKIAQQNTEEHTFWNPHIRQIDNGYVSPKWNRLFEFKIGDKTPFGLVAERRQGKNKNKDSYLISMTEYYRCLQEGVGLSDWISIDDMMAKMEVREWKSKKKQLQSYF